MQANLSKLERGKFSTTVGNVLYALKDWTDSSWCKTNKIAIRIWANEMDKAFDGKYRRRLRAHKECTRACQVKQKVHIRYPHMECWRRKNKKQRPNFIKFSSPPHSPKYRSAFVGVLFRTWHIRNKHLPKNWRRKKETFHFCLPIKLE